ncbi:MAG: beta-ketoacyl-[acyl-carrier-protein] synthase family protein, partial [Planctomycetaceae bacterium]|nr:beta-ketoacyl-[acyl-carrier-protein] synthase family protein [Planctomycetaceae bacterium]
MIKKEIVFTGIGVISPIGVGTEAYWASILENRSGIGFLQSLDVFQGNRLAGAEVVDFKPKEYFRSKKDVKQIKVMSRDIQLAFAAAMLACNDAGLQTGETDRNIDSDRLGISFGADLIGLELPELLDAFRAGIQEGEYDFRTWGNAAMEKIFPLWMLKYLPNMPACHIGIAHDARGPNNSITLQRGASLAALIEAVRLLERGAADVMICGGYGNCINPSFLARAKTHKFADPVADPSSLPRPFDIDRCGTIPGEGAAVFILETQEFAQARGAKIYAKVQGFCSRTDPKSEGTGIRQAIRGALLDADLSPNDIGHVNADGLGTVMEDSLEAKAVRAELGDCPTTSLKGYFGSLGSGAGAVELVGSLLGLQQGLIPPTKNCEQIAPDCPVNVVQHKPQPTK